MNSPLDYNSLDRNYDPICVYSHKTFDIISPYVSIVSQTYTSSPIKPFVDDIIKPKFDYISNQLDDLSNYVSAYREAHEQQVIEALETSSKSISNLINTITEFVHSNIIPVVLKSTKILFRNLNIYFRSFKIFCYFKWNIYFRPYLLHLLEKLYSTKLGLYIIKLEKSTYFQTFEQLIIYIYHSSFKFYNYIYEQINYIYNINVESRKTEAYELIKAKQAFLHDLAQYLPDSFNFKTQKPLSDSTSSTTTSISVSFTSSISISYSTSTTISKSSVSTSTSTISSNGKYELLLKNTIKSANEDFLSQVEEITSQYKSKIRNKFQPLIKELATNVNSGYDKIHDQLNRINEFKSKDHPLYVSRQDYRDSLAEKKSSIEEQVENIEKKLNEEIENYLDDVLKVRVGIIETLEEFADSTLTAYSANIISNGDDWKEWKRYKEIKNSLVKFRDELIDKKPNNDLDNFLNKLKREAYVLTNESGSYLAILRAKANIEFQAREKEEREAEAALANISENEEISEKNDNDDNDEFYEDEEPETSTITQTKFVTEVINTNLESTSESTNASSVDEELAPDSIPTSEIESTSEYETDSEVESLTSSEFQTTIETESQSQSATNDIKSVETEFIENPVKGDSDEVKVVLEPIEVS